MLFVQQLVLSMMPKHTIKFNNKSWGLFLVKGPFRQIFLGGSYIWGGGGLYMNEYWHFENAIFCSSNYNFLRFSAHNLSDFITDFS